MMMRPGQENKKSYYVDICINFTPLPMKSTGEEVPRASTVLIAEKASSEVGNLLIYLQNTLGRYIPKDLIENKY